MPCELSKVMNRRVKYKQMYRLSNMLLYITKSGHFWEKCMLAWVQFHISILRDTIFSCDGQLYIFFQWNIEKSYCSYLCPLKCHLCPSFAPFKKYNNLLESSKIVVHFNTPEYCTTTTTTTSSTVTWIAILVLILIFQRYTYKNLIRGAQWRCCSMARSFQQRHN